ncbi:MAG TPA: aminofutalosine synthase MqnE, partial [Planctomycetia bacterium]|nr:aminofutalosine synthase MqnE [Planctomycetia bacterium]
LFSIADLANQVRERKSGRFAYYNVNTHLNPTNVCVYRCNFCAFRSDLKGPKAYAMTDAEIRDRAIEAGERGVTEMHVVGGLHHLKDFDWYCRILRTIRATRPEIHLKAFTAVEIEWFARIAKLSIRRVLEELRAAGLDSLPGGGAEIFAPDVRRQLCEHKADAPMWLEVHRTAHELGIRSNATMLYGHIESAADRVDHLLQLRGLQDETGGFQTFIPLAFHPENNKLSHLPKPSGFEDLRTMAVCRLMLDNFPHVKAYWIMLGIGVAQAALWHGADDLDGTVVHEKIYHDAGAETPQALTVEQLRRLIEEAGRIPVERDTLYHEVRRDGVRWERGAAVTVAG